MSTVLPGFSLVADRLAFSLADGRPLFSDLTLGFGREKTGLVGPNGVGKTTLVRLLAGELAPSSGSVARRGTVGWLPQDFEVRAGEPLASVLGIDARLSALDRILAGGGSPADFDLVGDDGWSLRERAEALLDRFGLGHLSLERPVAKVSGGEATRVALAGLLLRAPDFLLLDEPTNNLDAAGREALYDFVGGWTGGLLVISHDRRLLGRMDRIVELTPADARVYGGNFDAYRAQKAAEEEAAARELSSAGHALKLARREAQRVRERQEKRRSQGKKEAATANMPKIAIGLRARAAQRTTARLHAVGARVVEEGRERVREAKARVDERARLALDLPSSEVPTGKVVLEMDGVVFRHPGAPAPVLDGVALRVVGPERVAVAGPNGSGKTTLLQLAFGVLRPDSGTVRLGVARDEVAFFDQHARRLRPDASVLENYRAANPDVDETHARTALSRFLFEGDAVHQRVATLSGGQRLRAALACTLSGWRPPKLLLLDEPTNHLDLDSLEALEEVLRGYDGALLVVSHDAAFLEAIGVERTLALPGREE